MCVRMCVCQWKAPASTALFPLDHSIQTPRVWIACGPQVPPTAHKHSCCCLPHWQWSGRLQAAGPHAILSAGALSQLVNMFCRRKFSEKHCHNRAKYMSACTVRLRRARVIYSRVKVLKSVKTLSPMLPSCWSLQNKTTMTSPC